MQQAAARKLDAADALVLAYNIAFVKGDQARMERVVARAKGKRHAEHALANAQALVLARAGHLQQARQRSSRAVELAAAGGRA